MTAVVDGGVFDAAHYRATLAEFCSARTLPAWCYTDPEFYRREMERCFRPNWHFIGHESELSEPGQYISTDLVIGPVLVVRGRDGMVRAFANTCRHRGARLLDNGHGKCATIVCPYHAWTYGHNGELRGAPAISACRWFNSSPGHHYFNNLADFWIFNPRVARDFCTTLPRCARARSTAPRSPPLSCFATWCRTTRFARS